MKRRVNISVDPKKWVKFKSMVGSNKASKTIDYLITMYIKGKKDEEERNI